MSALAVAPSLLDQLSGEPTLDDLIVGAWEGLTAHRVVACPVCEGELAPIGRAARAVEGAETAPLLGRCSSCGTVLA